LSKALCTDVANEVTSLGIQIHGGMGFVEETGAAQHYRDARIAAIYEGTNGIQAADLVGRKLGMRGGGVVADVLGQFDGLAKSLESIDGLALFGTRLNEAVAVSREASLHMGAVAISDPRSLLAGSVPYLRLLGTTVCAGLLAKAALAAVELTGTGEFSDEFLAAKISTARFFGEQILPTVTGLLPSITADADALFELTAEQLA